MILSFFMGGTIFSVDCSLGKPGVVKAASFVIPELKMFFGYCISIITILEGDRGLSLSTIAAENVDGF